MVKSEPAGGGVSSNVLAGDRIISMVNLGSEKACLLLKNGLPLIKIGII